MISIKLLNTTNNYLSYYKRVFTNEDMNVIMFMRTTNEGRPQTLYRLENAIYNEVSWDETRREVQMLVESSDSVFVASSQMFRLYIFCLMDVETEFVLSHEPLFQHHSVEHPTDDWGLYVAPRLI